MFWLLVTSLLMLAFAILWQVPKWQARASREDGEKPSERFARENEARKTLAQIVGGTAIIASLYSTMHTIDAGREANVTDRFTSVVEQLGSTADKGVPVETRVGAIFALEQIAAYSPEYQAAVVSLLTTYLQANAPFNVEPSPAINSLFRNNQVVRVTVRVRPDIQAAATVLGRIQRPQQSGLDLNVCDLRHVNMFGAHLDSVQFEHTQLQGADLRASDLRNANFSLAWLECTRLEDADLRGAIIDPAELSLATGNANTKLPDGLTMPKQWSMNQNARCAERLMQWGREKAAKGG